jgi:hypothetical protein
VGWNTWQLGLGTAYDKQALYACMGLIQQRGRSMERDQSESQLDTRRFRRSGRLTFLETSPAPISCGAGCLINTRIVCMTSMSMKQSDGLQLPLRNDQVLAWPNDLMFCFSFSATSDTTTTPVGRRQKRTGTYIRGAKVRSAPSSLLPFYRRHQ